MLLSKLFIPITKDLPAEAKIKSHQLMLRTGMIRQASAGIYSWLPLGFKVMKKIEKIVREEQNIIGAQEMLMPTVQSADIWKESGRYDDYGEEMLRISDRQKREMLYGPTNEEQITEIFRTSVKSYKLLPQILYHIQWKFRDELRPRFGVMRCREFYMKDAYSFDLSDDDAALSYNKMFFAYLKTFERLGLKSIPMKADTGPIGGDYSHEFLVLANTGESQVFYDKEISNLSLGEQKIDYENYSNLESIVHKFTTPYARTDETHDIDLFEKIPEARRVEGRGIEVGQIFYFGTKYSESMGAKIDLANGKRIPIEMGSHGIGVSRLVGALIEANHDEQGIIWPASVSPFDAVIINLKQNDQLCNEISIKIYNMLKASGFDILYDDRLDSVGAKFSSMDLIGIPKQIIVGPRGISEGLLEVKFRNNGQRINIPLSNNLIELINELKK